MSKFPVKQRGTEYFTLEECRKFPSTKAEAKKLGSPYFFSGQPCKYGHIYIRYPTNAQNCLQCSRELRQKKIENKIKQAISGVTNVGKKMQKFQITSQLKEIDFRILMLDAQGHYLQTLKMEVCTHCKTKISELSYKTMHSLTHALREKYGITNGISRDLEDA